MTNYIVANVSLGDYIEDYATVNFKFNTYKADGTLITLAGTPVVSIFKANNTTESAVGVTLTVDFDSITGLHNVLIDLSADAFYARANDYTAVITTGTVDGVSVVGTAIATFSIENRSTLDAAVASHVTAGTVGKAIRDMQQRLNGKVIIDRASGTVKVYNTDNVTLLETLTMTTVGNVDTIIPS